VLRRGAPKPGRLVKRKRGTEPSGFFLSFFSGACETDRLTDRQIQAEKSQTQNDKESRKQSESRGE